MPLSYSDIIIREFFTGFIRMHILYHAGKEPIFGLWMIKELARHGYDLSPGTLYPILHRLESNGFLKSERAVINGKWRKYYRITGEGRQALAQAHEKIRELVGELRE